MTDPPPNNRDRLAHEEMLSFAHVMEAPGRAFVVIAVAVDYEGDAEEPNIMGHYVRGGAAHFEDPATMLNLVQGFFACFAEAFGPRRPDEHR